MNKQCQHCNEQFKTTDSRRLYCSSECQIIARNKKQNESRRKELRIKQCTKCGKDFKQSSVTQRRCDECRECPDKVKVRNDRNKKRTHSISVTMQPSRLHIENMGHLAKNKEQEPFDFEKNSPKLDQCYMRVTSGKAVYFPKTKEAYERLMNRLNKTT